MRMTLLEMTQSILSAMDSDSINTLGDTEESLQVVGVIKDCYFHFINKIGFPEHKTLFELEASGDPTKPTLMIRPSNVLSIDWIKYNKQEEDDDAVTFQDIRFLELDDFLQRMYAINSLDDDTVTFPHVIGDSSITIFAKDNNHPSVWTTFDDSTILFDSYDSDMDTTLMKNKSLAFGLVEPTFESTDLFILDLDPEHYPTLMQECKEQAFAEIKQMPANLATRKAREGKISIQAKKRAVPSRYPELDRAPNYAR